MLKHKRSIAKILAMVLILSCGFLFNGGKGSFIQSVKAGNITNPVWALSSVATGATNVTYTLVFTTENPVPACGGNGCGGVAINMNTPPGPTSSLPNFNSASYSIAVGGTTYVTTRAFDNWSLNAGQNWLSVFANNVTNSALPAGEVTVTITGVTNPASGGTIETNIVTLYNGQAIDGNFGASNSSFGIGSVSMSGRILSAATSQGVANLRLEVHSQFGGGGFWQTRTADNGTFSFRGITAGSYIFEMSPGMDMQNASLSQYLRFDPMNVTISEGQTLVIADINLAVSSKTITGTIKYADTGGAVFGAMLNAFSNGGRGGFANGQSSADGSFSLKVGGGTSYFVNVMPSFNQMGGGQGQPQPANDFFPRPPRQVSFLLPDNQAETINLGDVLVDRADALVTGRLVKPDGTAFSGGGMGADNFQTHTNVPVMLQPDGTFRFRGKSGTGLWQLHTFDQQSQFTLPEVNFRINVGNNDLGTITMVALSGSITVTAVRDDTGSAIPNLPVMAMKIKESGPPFMAMTNSSGVATIRVTPNFEGRVMVNPGGEGGPGEKGPKGPGGPGPMGLWQHLVDRVFAEGPGGPIAGNQLYPLTPPQKVRAGDSKTFRFGLADKQVNVTTIKKGTNELMTDGGFINAVPTGSGFDAFGKGFGGPTAGGTGTIYTTAGNFRFMAFFPPESEWLAEPEAVTVASNGQSVAIEAVQKTVTITGQVLDSSNSNALIKDAALDIKIGIFGDYGFGMGKYDPATGTYTARFAPGMSFRIGVCAGDPGMGIQNGGYVPNISPVELQGSDGQTITQNVTLAKVDAAITGRITDQNGAGVSGVNVMADPGLADIVTPGGDPGHGSTSIVTPGGDPTPQESESIITPGGIPDGGHRPEFGFSGITDGDGNYTVNVSPNKYNLIVNAKDMGLFATGSSQVTVTSGVTATANIQMARADSTIRVEVNQANGNNLTDADVQIFNETGTIAFSAEVDANGAAEIAIPAGVYTIKAGKDSENGDVEESGFEKVVATSNSTVTETLDVVLKAGVLPTPVTQEIDSSSPAAISLTKNGTEMASINIPTGALTSASSMGSGSEELSSSNPILTVSPLKAQAVATKANIPVKGIGLDAIDGSGNAITSLSGMVSGKIAYSDSDLPPGAVESSLTVKYFNENSGQWDSVSTSSCDTAANECDFATTHFSDFAVVAVADTTSPAAPTSIAASAGNLKVTLTWTNPTTSDFAGIKIYRSTTSGTVGDLVTTIDNKTTTSYDNTGLTNGVTYYYTVRSYDTTGNISTNTAQVSATPGVLPLTGAESWPMTWWLKAVNMLSNLF